MSWTLGVTEKVAGGWLAKALRDAHAAMDQAQTSTEVDVQVTHAIRVAEQLALEVCDRDADGNPIGRVMVSCSGHAHEPGTATDFISITVTRVEEATAETPKRRKT
jgi:hypothetical protein